MARLHEKRLHCLTTTLRRHGWVAEINGISKEKYFSIVLTFGNGAIFSDWTLKNLTVVSVRSPPFQCHSYLHGLMLVPANLLSYHWIQYQNAMEGMCGLQLFRNSLHKQQATLMPQCLGAASRMTGICALPNLSSITARYAIKKREMNSAVFY